MEQRFKKVRKQLDDLGYMQVLIPEAIPLVEKLTADLIQTTESLQKYKKIAKDAIEERDSLQLGAEPYKCDNAKLVKECNDLHLAFLQFREQNEKTQKDLKRHLSVLEQEKLDCEVKCEKLRRHIRDLEVESANKTDRILALTGGKLKSKSSSATILKSRTCTASKNSTETNTSMTTAEQKIITLTKELKKSKDEQIELLEMNDTYKNQLLNRDREIERLNKMLEGGRPVNALNQDCCYKDSEGKVYMLQREICTLEKDKLENENRLKEAVAKQHEAMKRALHLAERNKQLENELRHIDQMALAVEADCNTAVKTNVEKVYRLQEQVNEYILQIQTLERDVSEIKRDKQELLADLDAVKLEKNHLQAVLETALDEKKRLNDRINQFTIIEHDLNLEIDRLVQQSASQKRKIAELECKLLADKFDVGGGGEHLPETPRKQSPKKKKSKSKKSPKKKKAASPKSSPRKKNVKTGNNTLNPVRLSFDNDLLKKNNAASPTTTPSKKQRVPENTPEKSFATIDNSVPNPIKLSFDNDASKFVELTVKCQCSCCDHKCSKSKDSQRQSLDSEGASLSHYKTERDYYMKEYQRLAGQTKNTSSRPDSGLLQKLNEKEKEITSLQHENKILAQEKHNLMTRLETARDRSDNEYDGGLSVRSAIRKIERERDMLKDDITRLEDERDALRQRLKSATEAHMADRNRSEMALMNAEEQIRKLELEYRDSLQSQSSRRAKLETLEEHHDTLKEQLRACQAELNHQKGLYTQLKTLQQQTDRALAGSQTQIVQLETELSKSRTRISDLETDKSNLDDVVRTLKNDVKLMRGNLAQIDQEKDGLLLSVDNKTERLVMLEQELKSKDIKIAALEDTIADLKKKLNMTMDSSSAREQLLRSASVESSTLRQELETALRIKDSAMQENRRIQDDLAAVTSDCRSARNELDICRRQVEDLKRQLQHYVAEVKRFEDLMEQKEVERNELLDQFRCLSQEATVLENNNHTLESEATQSKVQLSVTLDHVADLEDKLSSQECLIGDYEKQIAELSAQVLNLESQLDHYRQQQERTDADLVGLRDLCMQLDKQKDNLKKELNEKDAERSQVERDVLKLRRDSETLHMSKEKDRMTLESLERLLSEARQDNVQLKLLNQEMSSEVQVLKEKINDLESRL